MNFYHKVIPKGLFLCTSLFLALLLNIACAADDPDVGQRLAQQNNCTVCHSVEGRGVSPAFPNIGGQSHDYLVEQLKIYRDGPTGKRYNPAMYIATKNLTDDDINNIATFYTGQKLVQGVASPINLKRGEQLFRGGSLGAGIVACAACHQQKGVGATRNMPIIAGQNAAYLVAQLNAYAAGTRNTDRNHIMQDVAKKLTPEDRLALANYIQGLR